MREKVDFCTEAQRVYGQLVDWRRDFHKYPELGFEETRTAAVIARELSGFGYQVSTGVAKTGVVGLLDGAGEGPVVMMRFDMDALPIQEANEVEYASCVPGKMHACGHDGHLAIGLGVARLLAEHRDHWKGRIKLVFQPAEEGMGGAEQVIKEGVLDNPRVDTLFSLHLRNEIPVGKADVTAGPVMAASDRWELTVVGQGGHGARPHQTVDPVVAAAQVVVALQTIVSRSVDPLKAAVVSVGAIQGGESFNIIPSQVKLVGTARSFQTKVREEILGRLGEISRGVCEAMGAQVSLRVVPTCPALVNDRDVTAMMRIAAESVLGPGDVVSGSQTMGAEDAAFFLERVPGCYFFLGAGSTDGAPMYPNHNPRFDFDERALPLGVAILTEAFILCGRNRA